MSMHVVWNFAMFALCAGACAAADSNYPNRPIRMVVPFPTASPSDIIGRLLSQRLGEALGQSIVIDNKPGAGGVVGAETVAKATPDGYTLLMGGTGALAIIPGLNSKLSYDPMRDFAPISLVASVPFMIVVSNSVPASSIKALIAIARAKPKQMNFASSGLASTPHLAAALFMNLTGTDFVHVPYTGSAPALTDLYSGQVHMMITGVTALLSSVKANKIKGLAVASTSRSALMPDVPTVIEAGVPGYTASVWTGVEAPRRTSPETVARLNREIVKILSTPAMKESLLGLGADPVGNQPAEFAAYMREELAKWTKVIKALGIKEE